MVVPIRCHDIDLDDALFGLGDPGGLPNEMYGFIKLFQEVM
jgi:hypothetical protein